MDVLFEIIKYATQGFWLFIGVYAILALIISGAAYIVVYVFRFFLNFITTLIRGYAPIQPPKCECKNKK